MAHPEPGRIAPVLQDAQAALAQGRAAQAERLCRKALRMAPGQPQALQLLGVVLLRMGEAAAAVPPLQQAAAQQPDNADCQFLLGAAARASGDRGLAEASYAAAIRLHPGHADALNNLAGLLLERGAAAAAEAHARQATIAAPGAAPGHNTLGNALMAQGRAHEAIDSYRRAIARDPALVQAQDNLGMALLGQGRIVDAIAQFRRAVLADPHYPPAHRHLGLALRQHGAPAEAVPALRTAARLLPHDPMAQTDLADAQLEALQVPQAEAAYRAALALDAGLAHARRGLGNALAWQHRLDEARAAYRAAHAASPDWTAPLFHDGIIALLQGDYATGLPLYELRHNEAALDSDRGQFPQPRWTGDDPAGRTILLHDEQGFGDTLMFARYAPLLAARGARVILQTRPELCRLLAGLPGVAQVVPRGAAVPADAWRCPLPSLPWRLATTPDSIPATVPYLHAPADLQAAWRARLPAGVGLIALAWAGNPTPPHRAIPLAQLVPLLRRTAAHIVVVQRDITPADRALLAAFDHVSIPGDALADFADTAAILSLCDLTLSVDTAACHLAGALARPVGVALSYLPDWRWGLTGDTCPWYPTAHLDRQAAPGVWDNVVAAWTDRAALSR